MTGATDALAPYRALVEVAETELALASAGHWGELAGVHDAWGRALDALPARPPADAERCCGVPSRSPSSPSA